jgi:hypothetical protein
MSSADWDEQMREDLVRLKNELNSQSIKVLGPGFGFGRFKPNQEPAPGSESTSFQAEAIRDTARPRRQTSAGFSSATMDRPKTSPTPRPEQAFDRTHLEKKTNYKRKPIFYKFLKIHFVDIMFVSVTLFMVLCGIGIVLERQALTWDWSDFDRLLPFRLIQQTPWYGVVGGIYLVFVVYWLFFKVIVGQTLGEGWIWGSHGPSRN